MGGQGQAQQVRAQHLALEPPFESPVKARHDDDDLEKQLERGRMRRVEDEERARVAAAAKAKAAEQEEEAEEEEAGGEMRLKHFMQMEHEDLARFTYLMYKAMVVGFGDGERALLQERMQRVQERLRAGERAGGIFDEVIAKGVEEEEVVTEKKGYEDEGYEDDEYEDGEVGEEEEEEDDGYEEYDEEEEIDARWTNKKIEDWVSGSSSVFLFRK